MIYTKCPIYVLAKNRNEDIIFASTKMKNYDFSTSIFNPFDFAKMKIFWIIQVIFYVTKVTYNFTESVETVFWKGIISFCFSFKYSLRDIRGRRDK